MEEQPPERLEAHKSRPPGRGAQLGQETPRDPALDRRFLELAFAEAMIAYDAGEVPIGCVVVREGKVIGRGHNRMERLKDPTAHAEMIAITAACDTIGDWRLDGATLYVTLEPCPMCAGAILNSRVARVVYASADQRLGACGTTMDVLRGNPIQREVQVDGGVAEEDGKALLQQFFRERRAAKKQERDERQHLD